MQIDFVEMKDVVMTKVIIFIKIMFKMIKYLSDNLKYIIISLLGILAPIGPIIWTLTLLVIVDFIVGIYRAYKLNEVITSRKMSNTITKVLLYNIVIICLYFSNKYILDTGLPLEKLGAALICLVEMRSIDESWSLLFGWSIWEKLAKGLNRGKSTTKQIK